MKFDVVTYMVRGLGEGLVLGGPPRTSNVKTSTVYGQTPIRVKKVLSSALNDLPSA